MSFEEQWDNDGFLSNCSMQDAKHFYEAGAASRQAEIDELQKRIDCVETILERFSKDSCQDQRLFFGVVFREIKKVIKGEENEN